jgi:hypothetical protein
MVERMLEETGFTPAGWYTDEERLFSLALGRTGVYSEETFGEGYSQRMAAYFAWQAFGYLLTRYLHTFSMVHRHIGTDLPTGTAPEAC